MRSFFTVLEVGGAGESTHSIVETIETIHKQIHRDLSYVAISF